MEAETVLEFKRRLKTLKKGPDAKDQDFTYEEVFDWAMLMLSQHEMCTCRVLDMVRVAVKAISSQYTGENNTWAIEKQTLVGTLAMEVVVRHMVSQGLTVSGQLKRLVHLAVSLVAPWRSGLYEIKNNRPIMTKLARTTIAWVSLCPRWCPSVTLRGELLRFISMFELEDILDEDLSFQAAASVLRNVLNMTVTHLLPKGRIGLLWPIRNIIYHFCGMMGILLQRCRRNILQLVIGDNERAVAHLVLLMGQAAKRLLWLRRSGDLSSQGTVDEFMNILYILRMLVVWPPNMKLFDEPGMCRIAARAIAQTCHYVMQTPDARVSEADFVKLLIAVNDIMKLLGYFPLNGAVLEELRCYHGRCLSRLSAAMVKYKVLPLSVPEPREVKPDAPARFLDDLTGRMMDAPVKLMDTGAVVDQATLLTALLTTPVNPETDELVRDMSYELMTDLFEEIQVWKQEQEQEEQEQQPLEDEGIL